MRVPDDLDESLRRQHIEHVGRELDQPVAPDDGVVNAASPLGPDATVADGDGTSYPCGDIRVVGHHHDRGPEVVTDGQDEIEDRIAARGIEPAGRLVEQQRPRLRCDATHECRELAGAGTELDDRLRRDLRKPEPVEQLGRRGELTSAAPPGALLGVPDVLRDTGVRQQVAFRALHDERHIEGMQLRQPLAGHPSDVLFVDQDLPGRRREVARKQSQDGRLARAGRSEQRDRLTGIDVEVHPAQRDDIALR